MYHGFLINSFTNVHLGCLQLLAIVNRAAMNIGVHRFFWIHVLGSLGYNPSSGITGSKVRPFLRMNTTYNDYITSGIYISSTLGVRCEFIIPAFLWLELSEKARALYPTMCKNQAQFASTEKKMLWYTVTVPAGLGRRVARRLSNIILGVSVWGSGLRHRNFEGTQISSEHSAKYLLRVSIVL